MTQESIADCVRKCLEEFSLLENVKSPLATDSDRKAVLEIVEEDARFKIWSGNIGAHSTGRRSLQYRLRDASHLQKQVVSLLDELSELLVDAYAIAIGEKIPWDHVEDDEGIGFDSKSESDDDDVPATEMSQIAQNVSDIIDCLLRLSVAIRNPAPHDRFATFMSIDASHYEPFDIEHVRSKFREIEPFLADRLGRAISRRRQYFKYRESHHLKLSQGLGCREPNDEESTVASSLPQYAKAAGFSLEAVDEDEASDSGITQTSFASSHAGGDKLHVPPLPMEARNGPFECPFCHMMIIATSSLSWKRHVFADLRPYACLSKDCTASEMEFMRRRDWMLHEVQNHWRTYPCPCSCGTVFPAKSQCQEHVSTSHPGAFPKDQVGFMIDLNSKPINVEAGIFCPLCKELLHSVKEYQRHTGRHQEQLALFALPPMEYGGEEAQSEDDASGEHDSASSGAVRIGKLYIEGDDGSLAEEDHEAPPEPRRGEKDDEMFVNLVIPRQYLPKKPNAISEEALPHESEKEREAPSGAERTKLSLQAFNLDALGIDEGNVEIKGDYGIARYAVSHEKLRRYATATWDGTTGYTGDNSKCDHHVPISGDAVLVAYLDNGRNPEIARAAGRESLPFDEEQDHSQINSISEDNDRPRALFGKIPKSLIAEYLAKLEEERKTKRDSLTDEWNQEGAKYESVLEELKVETDAQKSSESTRMAEESQARVEEVLKQLRDHEERSQLKKGEGVPGEKDYENDYPNL